MTSNVDYTFPADDEKASKSEFRAILLVIYNEITALQNRISSAGMEAFYGFVTEARVKFLIKNSKSSYARDTAFGRITL